MGGLGWGLKRSGRSWLCCPALNYPASESGHPSLTLQTFVISFKPDPVIYKHKTKLGLSLESSILFSLPCPPSWYGGNRRVCRGTWGLSRVQLNLVQPGVLLKDLCPRH